MTRTPRPSQADAGDADGAVDYMRAAHSSCSSSLAAIVCFAFSSAACDPFHTTFDDVEDAVPYVAATLSPVPNSVDRVKMMTWNIKFGGGRLAFFWECDGTRGNMTRTEVTTHLDAIAEIIRAIDPDVLMVQEADIASKRCAYVDNVQWLLDHTALNYGAYASQWKADFVPSDGVGRIDSGNAVLSKFPISEATRIALPLISDQDPVTKYFFLRRNILRAKVQVPGRDSIWVLGTHASAFSDDGTKLRQILRLQSELEAIDVLGEVFVAGGDLNSPPPVAKQRHDFPDDCDDARFEGDDYREEVDWLNGLYNRYESAVPLVDVELDPDRYHTFSGRADVFWNRKIDYLFTNGFFGAFETHQSVAQGGVETLSRSDHAPISVNLELL